MSIRPNGKCSNPDCSFNQGGPCVDGFKEDEILEKCSNFSNDDSIKEFDTVDGVEDQDEITLNTKTQANENIALPSGQALYPEDLYNITRGCRAKIILFGGPTESGKTTLITSIYDQFRFKHFADHFFAGSETLLGFERRCHLSRAASGRDEAHTERTIASSREILHLKLAYKDNLSQKTDLFLVDISGELFEAALNSNEEIENIPLLRQADFFVYVFDGDRLSQKTCRQAIKNKGLNILRIFFENGALNTNSKVQIIFSKKDIFETGAGDSETEYFVNEIKNSLIQIYANKFQSLNFYSIAARPNQKASMEAAHGVDAIIKEWTAVSPPVDFRLDYRMYTKSNLTPFDGFCRLLEQ